MAFNAYGFAWKHAHKVPAPLFRGLLNTAADVTWLLKKGGVVQLEKNLRRIKPELTRKELRKLSHAGMRSYMRYFGEAFVLTHATPDQILHRVRSVGADAVKAEIDAGQSPILALSHQGNWDLAGVWASRELAPILTVAERLKPEEVFQNFLEFRQALGMTILAAGDNGVFKQLLRAASTDGRLIALLGDRDLSASGVEVELFGERARVAAGPAALAIASGAPLHPVGIHYEKLTGERKKRAGSPWGIVLSFAPAVEVDRSLNKNDLIKQVSQAWVDGVAGYLQAHPQDWHMLQKVFVKDLDPTRYAQTLQKEANGTA